MMKSVFTFEIRGITGGRGQIWVETVIYTLIGLAIIGLVLAVALPKINENKDRVMIEQSIEALGNIDSKIYDVQGTTGNRRVVNLNIKKGKLIIDMENDVISWILDSSFPYSEVDIPVSVGCLNVITRGVGDSWEVELIMEYGIDLRYNGGDFGKKELDVASLPYKFIIENTGKNVDGDTVIELSAV